MEVFSEKSAMACKNGEETEVIRLREILSSSKERNPFAFLSSSIIPNFRFVVSVSVWLSTVPNSNVYCKLLDSPCGSKHRNIQSWLRIKHVNSCILNFMALQFGFGSNSKPAILVFFAEFENSIIRWLRKEIEHQVFPMLSLAAVVVPPFNNLSSKVLSDSTPLKNNDGRINSPGNQTLIANDCQGCSSLAISKLNWKSDAIEPRTGIKFPTSLENPLREDKSNSNLEVLVGIGSRSMRIMKVKPLQVYAFGLYVHLDTVCEKLGPKYATMPIGELENYSNFFDDLLREDIHITVRLVVNCKGLKSQYCARGHSLTCILATLQSRCEPNRK